MQRCSGQAVAVVSVHISEGVLRWDWYIVQLVQPSSPRRWRWKFLILRQTCSPLSPALPFSSSLPFPSFLFPHLHPPPPVVFEFNPSSLTILFHPLDSFSFPFSLSTFPTFFWLFFFLYFSPFPPPLLFTYSPHFLLIILPPHPSPLSPSSLFTFTCHAFLLYLPALPSSSPLSSFYRSPPLHAT